MSEYMTTKEAAAHLRLHPETVLILARRKDIPSYRSGAGKRAARLYRKHELDAYIRRNTARTA